MRAAINTIILLFSSFISFAQHGMDDTVYYDKNDRQVSRSKAYYFSLRPKWPGEVFKVRYYTMEQPPDLVSEGHLSQGKKEGEWIYYQRGTGRIIERRSYRAGVWHGKVITYDSVTQAVIIENIYDMGRKEGFCKTYHTNGTVSTEGHFRQGIPVGEWWHYFSNGRRLAYFKFNAVGQVIHSIRYDSATGKKIVEGSGSYLHLINGDFTYYHKGTDRIHYKKNFRNGRANGAYTEYDSLTQKPVVEGQYMNDVMTSAWTYYYPNGSLNLTRQFKDGRGDGYFVLYDSASGKKIGIGGFLGGERHGKWEAFMPTGQYRRIENYKHGNLHGSYLEYDTVTYKLITEGEYRNDKRKGTWKYYYPENGQLLLEETYENDELNGEVTIYAQEGYKRSEGYYKNGLRHGSFNYFYPDGSTWIKLSFMLDSLDGNMETFYANGKMKRKDQYDNGKLVKSICLDEHGDEVDYYPFYQEASFKEDLMTYIGNNLNYPEEAKARKIEGKVLIRFTIKEDGSLDNIEAIERIGGGCDEEAIRLMTNMPLWKPLYIDGQPMETQKTLPIVFWLPEEKPDIE